MLQIALGFERRLVRVQRRGWARFASRTALPIRCSITYEEKRTGTEIDAAQHVIFRNIVLNAFNATDAE